MRAKILSLVLFYYYVIIIVAPGPVPGEQRDRHLDSMGGSQSSISHTPLPLEVRVTEHDGYFSEHLTFYKDLESILSQARVIVAVIDEEHTLKHWQGSVNYVTDYNKPSVGENMLEFWQSFEDILYVYNKFRSSCNAIADGQECMTEKVLAVGDSFYQFCFRGVSHGLCVMRIIELPSYGKQQLTIESEKKELENFKNTIVASISQNHFTPLMLMETSVDEIQREFQMHLTAIQVHEEAIMQFIEPHLQQSSFSSSTDLQDAFKAKTALQEVMKRLDRFKRQFDDHTKAVITQTSDLRQKTLNMLEYSEICSGTFSLLLKDRINLIDLCRDAHTLFSTKAAASKGIGFLTRISAGRFNPYITTDSQRFKQALFAILHNSVQFSHMNGDPIQFTLLMEGDFIRFICKDFGCGISEANLEKICDAFYSYDAMGNHQQSLGLGLFLSKRIIESMNGVLDITSQDGATTTVEIRLPMSCITHHEMEMESIGRPTSPGGIDARKPSIVTYNVLSEPEPFYTTVIISEDSPVPGKLLEKWVEKMGYLCELYVTGEAALKAFEEQPQKYFAALLDFFTPPSPMRGSDVATSMLLRNNQLTIIIISANEDAVVREAVNAAGVQFMHKPFQHHKEHLLKSLQRAFDTYHGS